MATRTNDHLLHRHVHWKPTIATNSARVRMSKDDGIAVSRWPGPVCRYARSDEGTVVRTVNAAFRRTFGDVPTGQSVMETLRSTGVTWLTRDPDEGTGVTSIDRAIVRANGERSTTGPILVRHIPADGDEAGFLLFSEIPEPPGGSTANDWIDVDDVASVVSHDLRNPLDVAKARLRAGRDVVDNEHFERVTWAHERMDRIIEDVLTLARGEEVVEPTDRTDLGGVAEQAWVTVRTEGATLTVNRELPTIVGDEDRILRLFENLFRNAVEHGQDSGFRSPGDAAEGESNVRIRIGGFSRGSTKGFFVADDGPGIPPNERDTVFRPGYSSDDHGTGIGLSIVDRVVALHDWSIEVTDAEIGGARFEITGIETV